MVPELQHASELPGGHVKTDFWGPLPAFLTRLAWGGVITNKFPGVTDAAGGAHPG